MNNRNNGVVNKMNNRKMKLYWSHKMFFDKDKLNIIYGDVIDDNTI